MLLFRRYSFAFGALLFALVATLLVAACGGGSNGSTSPSATTPAPTATATTAVSTTPTKVVQVKIVEKNDKYSFDPASITIPKGAEVVWTNASDASHTVISNDNTFQTSSSLMEHQTFKMVFNTTGTFAYHCSIHTYMKGIITVTS